MNPTKDLLKRLNAGDIRALARCITLVENEYEGHHTLLKELSHSQSVPVVGITGPPGAGKSSLISAMLNQLSSENKRVAVIAVDPTSPFTQGSLLGDRVRMSEHFNNPNIFIRSMATRGSLGGLSAKIIEVTDIIKAASFDFIIIETVGVGQSEVEIAGLADTTVLVLVPEGGDEVQTIKSGIMEIADIYVINKSDREGADLFVKNIEHLLHLQPLKDWRPKILKTSALKNEGIRELLDAINAHALQIKTDSHRKAYLLTEKALRIIQQTKMRNINRQAVYNLILQHLPDKDFNLYNLVDVLLADE